MMYTEKERQLVFIDESGDPGFLLDSGASPYFSIGVVIFKNSNEANAMMKTIKELKIKLKIKTELKFSKSNNALRKEYLKAINTCSFFSKVLFVNKDNIYKHDLRTKPRLFYNFILKQVLEKSNLSEAKVVLDGKASKSLTKEIKTYLRKSNCGITNFSLKDSKDDLLVQVADTITGAVTCDYKKGVMNYINLIDKKKLNVWPFK